MRSKIASEILSRPIRKREKRFNAYFSLKSFSIGISISKPFKGTGWNLYVSIDIMFISFWVYFLKLK
jgi:hypothetical protein